VLVAEAFMREEAIVGTIHNHLTAMIALIAMIGFQLRMSVCADYYKYLSLSKGLSLSSLDSYD
jgi:hypothetical protein